MNAIEKVLLPLKSDAIERAGQEAAQEIADASANLAEAGGDINKAAPFPDNGVTDKAVFYQMRRMHSILHALTIEDRTRGEQRNNGVIPFFVVLDPDAAERYVTFRKSGAAADYDDFVRKAVTKIGPAKKASLEGNHVWGFSILSVTNTTGETQRWRVQQIVNTSKTGKLFNQWQTRRLPP